MCVRRGREENFTVGSVEGGRGHLLEFMCLLHCSVMVDERGVLRVHAKHLSANGILGFVEIATVKF